MGENGAERQELRYTHWQRWEILRGLWDLEDRQKGAGLSPPPLLHSVTESLCLLPASSSPHFPRKSVPPKKGFINTHHLEIDFTTTAAFAHYAWACFISTSSEPD